MSRSLPIHEAETPHCACTDISILLSCRSLHVIDFVSTSDKRTRLRTDGTGSLQLAVQLPVYTELPGHGQMRKARPSTASCAAYHTLYVRAALSGADRRGSLLQTGCVRTRLPCVVRSDGLLAFLLTVRSGDDGIGIGPVQVLALGVGLRFPWINARTTRTLWVHRIVNQVSLGDFQSNSLSSSQCSSKGWRQLSNVTETWTSGSKPTLMEISSRRPGGCRKSRRQRTAGLHRQGHFASETIESMVRRRSNCGPSELPFFFLLFFLSILLQRGCLPLSSFLAPLFDEFVDVHPSCFIQVTPSERRFLD